MTTSDVCSMCDVIIMICNNKFIDIRGYYNVMHMCTPHPPTSPTPPHPFTHPHRCPHNTYVEIVEHDVTM